MLVQVAIWITTLTTRPPASACSSQSASSRPARQTTKRRRWHSWSWEISSSDAAKVKDGTDRPAIAGYMHVPSLDPNQRKSEVRGFVFFVVHGPSPGC